MTLEHWQKMVAPHLHVIQFSSRRVGIAADALPIRPNFDTWAEHELLQAEEKLRDALACIEKAKAAYYGKPVETDHRASVRSSPIIGHPAQQSGEAA